MPEDLGKLIITSADEPAERVYALSGPVVRIGRAAEPQNDVVLNHGWVSRAHARIYCDRLPYRVQDLGSSNGTSVNDVPLKAEELRPLKDGDVIAIGHFRLRFEAPPPPPEREPAPAVREPAAPEPGVRLRAQPAPPPPPEPPSVAPAPPRKPERWEGMPEHVSRWLQYLPPIYGDDEFLGRFLLIFEDLLGPLQQIIAHWDLFLDPATAPASFVPQLNEWLAHPAEESWPIATRRQVLREASYLYQARGTKAGLLRYMQLVTACDAEIIENSAGPHTFKVILRAEGRPIDRRAVERIINACRPAHTAYSLEIA